jgi:hypothetical protein
MAHHGSTRHVAQLRLLKIEQEIAALLQGFPELRSRRAGVARIAEARALLHGSGPRGRPSVTSTGAARQVTH